MRFRTLAIAALIVGGAPAAQAQALNFPRGGLLIHGNYCGPGNRAPLPPIDALDAACARHDACSPGRGRPASAGCNDRLRREAEAVANDPRQPSDLRGTAGFIAFGAALLPSAPGGGPYADHAYRHAGAPVPLPPVVPDFDPEEDE
jgi:hypothetical protein